MLYDTRGIVFQQFKYSESSIIVKIFTEQLGLQSYIVKGVRSKKAKLKPALFQPLSLLDLVVYHKEKKKPPLPERGKSWFCLSKHSC